MATTPGHEGLRIDWVEAHAQAVALQSGDILVVMVPHRLSLRAWESISRDMAAHFPGHKIVCLEEGMTLGVLRPGQPEEPAA